MIGYLKNIPAREWIHALERNGFTPRKNKGSRHVYQHPDGRRVLIVYHKSSAIHSALRQSNKYSKLPAGQSTTSIKRLKLIR